MLAIKIITFILLLNSKNLISQSDTSNQKLNMDAVYDRPFLKINKLPMAIGGYLEANTQYSQTDGISEGLSFQARRFTLFFSSTIADRIKFLSELEFEDGTKEINIEFAAVDFEIYRFLNIRGGIIMNPIGAFNQNHDGPRWDFIDRPLSATTLIPSTLSSVGFGLHGKHFYQNWIFGYEAYLTNGFDNKIIDNPENRTSLGAGKKNINRFEESFSGVPMFTGKLALRNRNIGEIGISYLNGVYNQWKQDGIIVDSKRYHSIFAIDFNTSLFNNKINILGEYSKLWFDIPSSYTQQYGSQQQGFYFDVIARLFQKKIFNWEKSIINLGLRIEYVDYNIGIFKETNTEIGDYIWAFVPTLSFRPVSSTVIRFNYRYQNQTDILRNPAAINGTMQFGISTYF